MSGEEQAQHHGSCLCGQVRWQLQGDPVDLVHCHCQQCRKASGTAFTSNFSVPADALELSTDGSDLGVHASSKGVQRWFCRNCGTPVYKTRDREPGWLRLRLGLLDSHWPGRAVAHIWVQDQAPWFQITDDLPQFPRERGSR